MRITSGGSVRINTTSSFFSEKLVVNGLTRSIGLHIAGGVGNSNYGNFTHDDDNMTISTTRVSGSGHIILSPYGNVGIGTNTPNDKLNIHNGSANANLGIKITRGSQTHGLRLGVNNSHAFLWTDQNQDLAFATNNAQRLTIQAGGNVGIGTTSPSAKLQVNNTSLGEFAGGNSSNAGGSHLILMASGDTSRTLMSGPSIVFKTPANSDGTNIWATSRILGSPAAAGSARGTISLQVRDLYDPLSDGTSWNWRTALTAINNGNVGIGTNSPGALLEINGVDDAGATDLLRLEFDNSPADTGVTFTDLFGAVKNRITMESNNTNKLMISAAHSIEFSTNTTSSNTNQRLTINNSGEVGIGTIPEVAGPTWRTLFIGSSLALISRQSVTGTDALLANNYYINSSNVDKKRVTGTSSRIYLDGDVFRFQNAGSANADTTITWSEPMRIAANGNVGIGTTLPNAKLEILNANPVIRQSYNVARADGNEYVAGGVDSYFRTRDANINLGAYINILDVNTNGSFPTAIRGGAITFGTIDGGTGFANNPAIERMRIDSSGNVGIGTDNPQVKLQVVSSGTVSYAQFQTSSTGSNGSQDGFTVGVNGSNAFLWQRENSSLNLGTNDTSAITIDNLQKVGIGTTLPTRQLHLKRTSGDVRGIMVETTVATSYAEVHVKAAREFRIGTGGSNSDSNSSNRFFIFDATASAHRFTIDSAGNVGIGKTVPSQKLDVAGIGQFAGAIRITETGTAQHILIGNQDSGGTNKPGMIRSANASLEFGYGNSWSGEGGTMTTSLTLGSDSNATFAGDVTVEGTFHPLSLKSKAYDTTNTSSSVTAGTSLDDEYELLEFGESASPVYLNIKTGAHNSASFVITRGYFGSNTASIQCTGSTYTANGGYANIRGLRVIRSGNAYKVIVRLFRSGSHVGFNLFARAWGGTASEDIVFNSTLTDTFTETVALGEIGDLSQSTSLSAAFSRDAIWSDNAIGAFGNAKDLMIYHDGSNSYINENGTGSLIVQASDLFLRAGGTNNTNNAIVAANGGPVTLYHANSAKLATTSTGVTVTGNISVGTATTNHTISVPDYTGDNFFNGDRGNIEIKASSSPNSGNNAKSGGRVLLTAGNSYNGQSSDIIISSGKNHLNAADNGKIRFNIGGSTSGFEKMRIDSNGFLLVGGNASPSTSWKGTAVFGQQGTNKVIIGYLTAFSENVVGGHNSALDAWDSLTLAGTDFKFRTGSTANDTSVVINSSGNVGIGVTSSLTNQRLYVASNLTYGVRIDHQKNISTSSPFEDALFLLNTTQSNTNVCRIGMSTNGTDGQHHRVSLIAERDTSASYRGEFSIAMRQSDTTHPKRLKLDYAGNLTVSGDVIAFGSPSDISLKENIKPIKSALDKVQKLQGVTFNWKKSDNLLDIKEDIGFIAQDVQKVLPELVKENDNGKLSLRHQGIVPVLLEAIKELKAEIEELKKHRCDCKE